MKPTFGILCRVIGVVALVLPGAVSAQQPLTGPAVAEWLATEACGDFLTGDLKLVANPALKERGFEEAITKRDSKLGPLELVTAKFGDSEIAFGGAVDKICTVVVTGELAGPSLPLLRKGLDAYNVKFERDDEKSKALSTEISVEFFKAKVTDEQNLYITLIGSLKAPTAMASFQLFGTKE